MPVLIVQASVDQACQSCVGMPVLISHTGAEQAVFIRHASVQQTVSVDQQHQCSVSETNLVCSMLIFSSSVL
jgi:hypothetical protein